MFGVRSGTERLRGEKPERVTLGHRYYKSAQNDTCTLMWAAVKKKQLKIVDVTKVFVVIDDKFIYLI